MPIFLSHAIGGSVYNYRDFCNSLGPTQSVFAFQAPSLLGTAEPFDDLVAQARTYVEALLEHRPQGPYILGGSSYGGLVAYEMGQQLIRLGHEVPLLIIIDSPAPGAMPGKFDDSASILYYLLEDELPVSVEELRKYEPAEQLAYVMEQARLANRPEVLPPDLGMPMFNTWMAHQKAMHTYKPDTYPGRVIFFRATEAMKINPLNMHAPWVDMVKGGIEIHQTPGNHNSMIVDPNVKKIGRFVKNALRSIRVNLGK